MTVFYDRFASSYDWVTRWISQYRSPTIIAQQLLPLASQSSRVLDVGIGTGASIDELFRSKRFSRIVGLDISEAMLNRCRAKYPDIELIQGEIANLGAKFNGAFDIVLSCGVVEHISNFRDFVRQCRRVLCHRGYLLFTYEPMMARSLFQRPNSPHLGSFGTALAFRHQPAEIAAQLQTHGFSLLSDKPFRAYLWLTHRVIVARAS